MTPLRALSICSDPGLASSRHQVLALQFVVMTTGTLKEVREVPPEFYPEVIVLCHSIPNGECAWIASVIRERWPLAKILALTAHFRSFGCSVADQAMEGSDGPGRLLAMATLLSWRHGSSVPDSIQLQSG